MPYKKEVKHSRKITKLRSLPALQISIIQDNENRCDLVFVLFFWLPPNVDSCMTSYRKPELIKLAKAVAGMNLPTDPNFENDSIEECLIRRLTLPAGIKLTDPFQMTSLSNDFSQLPSFGLMDIFNHLIMSKADYDKSMLSSWYSFEEFNLSLNGHI